MCFQDQDDGRFNLFRACFLLRGGHLQAVCSPGGSGEGAPFGLFHKDITPFTKAPLS